MVEKSNDTRTFSHTHEWRTCTSTTSKQAAFSKKLAAAKKKKDEKTIGMDHTSKYPAIKLNPATHERRAHTPRPQKKTQQNTNVIAIDRRLDKRLNFRENFFLRTLRIKYFFKFERIDYKTVGIRYTDDSIISYSFDSFFPLPLLLSS